MNDVTHSQPPPATDLQALTISDGEAKALLDRVWKRSAPPAIPTGLLGLSAGKTRQFTLFAAAIALAEVVLIAGLPGLGKREPLQHALGVTLLEGRTLTPRDVYVLHLWGKP
jgi:hypothetical protein